MNLIVCLLIVVQCIKIVKEKCKDNQIQFSKSFLKDSVELVSMCRYFFLFDELRFRNRTALVQPFGSKYAPLSLLPIIHSVLISPDSTKLTPALPQPIRLHFASHIRIQTDQDEQSEVGE